MFISRNKDNTPFSEIFIREGDGVCVNINDGKIFYT
jgi:hypothetical protein